MAPSACAACRSQRKKCSNECLLAPHFPPDDLQTFATIQRAYGFNNVVKMLKDVKEEQRAEVVNSLVYEARARMEDTVNGCTREIHQLQKRIADLESQLAHAQAELLDMHFPHENVFCIPAICEEVDSIPTICEEVDSMLLCEPLWEV